MLTIKVAVDDWQEVALVLRDDPRFAFSQLTDLCGVDFLGFGQDEWETSDATRDGFSRGVEGMGPGRFDWKNRRADDVEQRFAVVVHLLSITRNTPLADVDLRR